MLDEENNREPLDPQKVREFMFEAISAMGPRIFRPDQKAHGAHGTPQAQAEISQVRAGAPVCPVVFAFIAGTVAGTAVSAWRRRHR